MSEGGIAADQLRLLIERIERLEEEKKGLNDDIKDVYLESKATGYDPKIMRQIIRLRKMQPHDRQEHDAILQTYLAALGDGMMGVVAEILPPIDAAPIEPFSIPILLNDHGYAWIPHGFRAGTFMEMQVGEGASIGWAPIPELNKALVTLWGGNPFAPTDEAIAFAISRRGLRGIIAGLQSIERQLDGL